MAAKDVLTKALEAYETTKSHLAFTLRQARAEYSRLAKIARKRLMRMGESIFRSSDIYLRYKNSFQPLAKSESESNVRKALWEVAYFLNLKTSSITGQKARMKKYVETMGELGYSWINAANAESAARFMGEAQKYYGSKKAYDSEQILNDYRNMYVDGGKAAPKDVEKAFEEYVMEIEGRKPEKQKREDKREEQTPPRYRKSRDRTSRGQRARRERKRR